MNSNRNLPEILSDLRLMEHGDVIKHSEKNDAYHVFHEVYDDEDNNNALIANYCGIRQDNLSDTGTTALDHLRNDKALTDYERAYLSNAMSSENNLIYWNMSSKDDRSIYHIFRGVVPQGGDRFREILEPLMVIDGEVPQGECLDIIDGKATVIPRFGISDPATDSGNGSVPLLTPLTPQKQGTKSKK